MKLGFVDGYYCQTGSRREDIKPVKGLKSRPGVMYFCTSKLYHKTEWAYRESPVEISKVMLSPTLGIDKCICRRILQS